MPRPPSFPTNPIRLIVADIDGCLSRGTGSHFCHKMLQRFADANTVSRNDPTVPAITFCTGRPQPYVECLLQAVHGYRPALCEGGTVFFDLTTHSIFFHPSFTSREQDLLTQLRRLVDERIISPHVMHEPGKVSHITLITHAPASPEMIFPIAQEIVSAFDGEFIVEMSKRCVHILFRDIHKGVGIDWLSEKTGIIPSAMAGIGDARPDLPFLQRVGLPFAPENAHEDVKAVCCQVSALPDSEAAIELLDLVVKHNRTFQ
jgi:hydroxymethylpyrimidine pyrophosphatase-like HAD family hydrolase